jgi:SAM-dependent methyltransferase
MSFEAVNGPAEPVELFPVVPLRVIREEALARSRTNDRNLVEYRRFLAFEPSDIVGRRVLDIGSGYHRIFGREAEEIGASEVISLDPNILSGMWDGRLGPEKVQAHHAQALADVATGKLVRGLSQEMPFEDRSFDTALALFSVPLYLPLHQSERSQTFREILRILKPGGRAFVFPVSLNRWRSSPKHFLGPEVVDIIQTSGASLEAVDLDRRLSSEGLITRQRLVIQKR